MNATTTYKPLTLKAQKGTPAVKIGEVHLYGETHTVSVSRLADGSTYKVRVRIGSKGGFVDAGRLTRHGNQWHINSFNANSVPDLGRAGYMESGTMARNAERVVSSFLCEVDYAKREAAKTPEQREAEEQAYREAVQRGQQARIASAAENALAMLNDLVPDTTVHYAVEDARRALQVLINKADTIKTKGV